MKPMRKRFVGYCSLSQDVLAPALPGGTPPDSPRNFWLTKLNHVLENGAGSLLLLFSAILSIAIANHASSADPWIALWSTHLGPAIGDKVLTAKEWVNEGLMALFFFSVGLEIKRELVDGALASLSRALLPCIAAFGGMVVPMLVYSVVQMVVPGGNFVGITVPMATDIAFAMGVFCLFRKRMPPTAAPFLLALATVDDLGAIVVIIFSGGNATSLKYIGLAALILSLAAELGRRGLREGRSARRFVLPGLALWYCLLRGGLNADVAGVFVALCVPMRSERGTKVVEPLVQCWAPFCALVILPAFALANCAIPLAHFGRGDEERAVPMGISWGLTVGKPLGIISSTWLAVKFGWASLPPGLTMKHIVVLGVLGGIGFTMCLFLVETSMEGLMAQACKFAILRASAFMSLASAALLSCLPLQPRCALQGVGAAGATQPAAKVVAVLAAPRVIATMSA